MAEAPKLTVTVKLDERWKKKFEQYRRAIRARNWRAANKNGRKR